MKSEKFPIKLHVNEIFANFPRKFVKIAKIHPEKVSSANAKLINLGTERETNELFIFSEDER